MGEAELCRIVKIEHIVCSRKSLFPDKSAHTLLVIAGGMGVLQINEEKHPVSIGKCFYAVPDSGISITPHFNELKLYRIFFDRLSPAEHAEDGRIFDKNLDGFANQGELFTSFPDRVLDMAASLYDNDADDENRAAGYKKQMIFYEILHELASANAPVHSIANTQEAVKRTIHYIQTNYEKDLTRDKLANMAKLSPEYYSVVFKQVSGTNLTDYITQIRIQMAKERLLFSDERLSDIAKAVGYKDEYYLSRKFKKEVGVSPSAYIKTPKKIVSMNPHLTRHLLALDVMPAATLSFRWMFGEYQERLNAGQCECRDWMLGFQDDELQRMKPDLMVCIDNISPEKLGTYRRMAPTLVVPWHVKDWRSHFRMISHAVGKSAVAETWLRHFDERVEQVRFLMGTTGAAWQSVALFNIRAESSFVYRNHGMGSQIIYDELRLQPPSSILLAPDQVSISVAPADFLPRYAADCIILSIEKSDRAEWRARDMLGSPAWQEWLSGPSHRLHIVDMDRWHGYDPISATWQLDDVERLLSYHSPSNIV
ncbi:helix-turn-helix domain-containing protein [Paenibacillus eucommiae]|uniref:AraC-like DNA-binding protein n=1 Tax=Paenibacillus eucommiae TaxID=1355755 RepID=A0ABS4J7B9_9BACL|nr:AraC family transcriptional regulator [Paenibacillus eucommiae]MBP1995146.1 AraC-like DNA-binding protein [Paenibacillus eucommiae]